MQNYLGPVADKRHVGKSLLKCIAWDIILSLLTNPITVIAVRGQIIPVRILQGCHVIQRNHLPVTGFLLSQQCR